VIKDFAAKNGAPILLQDPQQRVPGSATLTNPPLPSRPSGRGMDELMYSGVEEDNSERSLTSSVTRCGNNHLPWRESAMHY